MDLTTINVFRYNSDGSWTAIPFQIDKRRKINLRNNIADPAEGWNYVDVCEYGYFTELSFSIGGAYDVFASNTLGSRDELVFMLKDAGEILAPINAWIDGSSTTRRRITLTDPVTAGATRFVYVYSFPGGVPTSGTAARSTTRYVQYTQDDPIPTGCVAHTCPNCSRQVYPCGTAEGLYGNLGGLESQRVHFLKNWVTDEYHIAEGSLAFPKAHVNNPLLPDNVYADDLQKNIDTPMTFADLPEYQFNTNPPPPTPCTPAAPTAVGDTNGAADLTIDKTGCDASLRFRVYRGVGSSGSLFLLADVGTGSALHDLRVTTGSAYRYAVSSYNGTNAESALSATTSVTVTDTTAPSVPAAVVATPGNTKATVSWKQVPDRDLYGYDLYMSTGGGAYEKLNGSAQPAWVDRTWTQVGLTNGLQYCFKIVALDFNGNPSGMSMEGCATPAP